jgi:hypothetical protein
MRSKTSSKSAVSGLTADEAPTFAIPDADAVRTSRVCDFVLGF